MANETNKIEREFNEDEILEVLRGNGSSKPEKPLCPYGVNRGNCDGVVDGEECAGKPYDCKYYVEVKP